MGIASYSTKTIRISDSRSAEGNKEQQFTRGTPVQLRGAMPLDGLSSGLWWLVMMRRTYRGRRPDSIRKPCCHEWKTSKMEDGDQYAMKPFGHVRSDSVR